MNIGEEDDDDSDADWQHLVDLVANAEITETVRKKYRMNCRRFASEGQKNHCLPNPRRDL